jgi:predicted nucleic acid-binding protein
MSVYVDTSALAKRYLAEQGSDAFDEFLLGQTDDFVITPLVATELDSLLQRLLRQRLVDLEYTEQVRRHFSADLRSALWSMRPFESVGFTLAGELIRQLAAPLATLDALHLASAIACDCSAMATGDRQLAKAAAERGLAVHPFFP